MAENTLIADDAAEEQVPELTDEQMIQVWTNVMPRHPALRRVHEKLNQTSHEAAITSYDRMHHRHNR